MRLRYFFPRGALQYQILSVSLKFSLRVMPLSQTKYSGIQLWKIKFESLSAWFSLATQQRVQAQAQTLKSFMSSENECDASTSTSTRKGNFLNFLLVLMLASRPFLRWNKHSHACACACVCAFVAIENLALPGKTDFRVLHTYVFHLKNR